MAFTNSRIITNNTNMLMTPQFSSDTLFSNKKNDSFANDLARAQMLLEYLNLEEQNKKITENESLIDPNTLHFEDFDGAYCDEESASMGYLTHQQQYYENKFDYYSDSISTIDDESLHTIEEDEFAASRPFNQQLSKESNYNEFITSNGKELDKMANGNYFLNNFSYNANSNDNGNYVPIDEWKKSFSYDIEEELISNFEMTSHKRHRISMIMHYERQVRQMEQEIEDRLIEQEVLEWVDGIEI
ncbi:3610_t:CDS:1 [Ambispora gerdemannii]|uniref:3610_t:CDS:1 n=1 Tax=Ambispora gerdemannii TaxID=144530 RepID=A0A9N9GSK5_9GLOM|nr:3610_t:CDS:1 [Ambispora gerdemannii]